MVVYSKNFTIIIDVETNKFTNYRNFNLIKFIKKCSSMVNSFINQFFFLKKYIIMKLLFFLIIFNYAYYCCIFDEFYYFYYSKSC